MSIGGGTEIEDDKHGSPSKNAAVLNHMHICPVTSNTATAVLDFPSLDIETRLR